MNRIWLRHLLLYLLCLHSGSVCAQGYWENYEVFTTRSGLPNNVVLSMTQDDRGLLYIGTRNGLCIYDGYEFQVKKDLFDADDGEWRNIFCALFKARDGNIWMGTQNGRVAMLDPQTGAVVTYELKAKREKEYITSIHQASDGKIWMAGGKGGLYLVDTIGKKLLPIAASCQVGINTIQIDRAGNFVVNNNTTLKADPGQPGRAQPGPLTYVAHDRASLYFHKRDGAIINVKEDEIISKRQFAFHRAKNGNVLIATSWLIKEYDTSGKLLHRLGINDDHKKDNDDVVNFIYEDATGLLWLGTNVGLLKINKDKYRLQKFSSNSYYGKLNSDYVRSVLVAGDNDIWVGYKAGDVSRLHFDSMKQKYEHRDCRYSNPEYAGAATNVIKQLRSGIVLFGGSNGLFSNSLSRPALIRKIPLFVGRKPVSEVWAVMEDKTGKVWVGARTAGLFIIDMATGKYRHYPYAGFQPENKGLTSVWNMLQDHKGDIWLATVNGLDSVVLGTDGYPAGFYNLHDSYSGSPGKQVWSIAEDNYKRLWIGTTDKGLSLVDKTKRAFITYTQKSGLSGNVVCSIVGDADGRLWMSTLNGISVLDPSTMKFRHFTEQDGLPGNDFNFNAACRAPSGNIFFGSKSGLVSFNPQLMDEAPPLPGFPVIIRAFNLWNRKHMDNPSPSQPINLTHKQNSFSFSFTLPEYKTAGTHRFKYMLEGFDKHWNITSSRDARAVYTNIPPGDYTFLVAGSINGARWNQSPTKISVVIKPAFWQQTWFQVLVIATGFSLVILLVYLYFRRSLNRQREKSLLAQRFAELEFRALQAQMNPHFIFNSINSIQHFMLSNDEMAANSYLSRFARLMRLYLESSKNKYIAISEEVELLKLYVQLEQLRFADKFNYSFDVDPYFEHCSLEIPSMLLQPYVENAINHGLALRNTPGTLRISIKRTESGNGVLCIIDDDGVGRDTAERKKAEMSPAHKSRGTSLIQDRLNAYRQVDNVEIITRIIDKKDTNGNSFGTRVEVLLPDINH